MFQFCYLPPTSPHTTENIHGCLQLASLRFLCWSRPEERRALLAFSLLANYLFLPYEMWTSFLFPHVTVTALKLYLQVHSLLLITPVFLRGVIHLFSHLFFFFFVFCFRELRQSLFLYPSRAKDLGMNSFLGFPLGIVPTHPHPPSPNKFHHSGGICCCCLECKMS